MVLLQAAESLSEELKPLGLETGQPSGRPLGPDSDDSR